MTATRFSLHPQTTRILNPMRSMTRRSITFAGAAALYLFCAKKLRIGYNRAARLIETMEAAGVVSEMGSNGQREVLAPPPQEE